MPLDVNQPPAFSISEDPSSVATRWKKWYGSFEYYIAATGVDQDAQKRALLLHVAGPEVQEVFSTFTATCDNYNNTVEALKAHFLPKTNKRYERVLFRQINQEARESSDNFVTRLRKLAESCDFHDVEDAIVDQFIEKCCSSSLRRKLLQEQDLTLEKLLQIARSLEAADQQANVIESAGKNSHTATLAPKVNLVKQGHRPDKSFQKPRKWSKHLNAGLGDNSLSKPQSLGGKNCTRCGKPDHNYSQLDKCPAKNRKCSACGKLGHFMQFCRSPKKVYQTSEVTQQDDKHIPASADTTKPTDVTDFVFEINSVTLKKPRIMLDVLLNGKPVSMQLDTASDVSVVSEELVESLPNVKLSPSPKFLKDYNNQVIEVFGSTLVDVEYQNKTYKALPLTVVAKGKQCLFGLDWLRIIPLDWKEVMKVESRVPEESLSQLLKQYELVFREELGIVRNATATLQLQPNAQPKFCAPRSIPFALKPQVEQELQRLVENGSLEKVTYSDWGTPLVPVVKGDGNIRLCGDYKVTVNPQLQVAQHPLPNPENVFATLGGCKVFSKLDLKSAFQQLVMDDESQQMCTLSTHLGLFKPKRLPYGVASSPALWQQVMDKIFTGMPGIFCFVDDILIAGRDEAEHLARLKAVLQVIQENGLRIRKDKCQFAVKLVEYLGFRIDGNGIHKTQDKIAAIKNAKIPENVEELKSFMGLVTFYNRFIQNLATIAHPLYALLKKDAKWDWSDECQQSVADIKKEILSPTFLTHYKPNMPIKLRCDASSHGIGAVIAHVMPDGTERPIAFASRSLSQAEKNYSQIEKEGLAIVYGVKKFHLYLYAKSRFTIVTDHKPLLAILGPKAGLPTLVAARLQRWAVILSAYSYDLEHCSSSKIGNADALSRLPLDAATNDEELNVMLIDTHYVPVTAREVAIATKRDPVLARLSQELATGRHSYNGEELEPYLNVWSELALDQGCITRGGRVVVPSSLKETLLREIHSDHQGIVRSKAVARTFMWWPNMNKDIERYVKNCMSCAMHQNEPKQTRMHPWEYPQHAWQRLHIDYAGPFLNSNFLVIVDAYSKWPEVIPMSSTTSRATISTLMSVFATHGLPVRVVTDNGPQFCSDEFSEFLRSNGIQHTRSAPYHPSTNGEAERLVQTFKHNMKCRGALPHM